MPDDVAERISVALATILKKVNSGLEAQGKNTAAIEGLRTQVRIQWVILLLGVGLLAKVFLMLLSAAVK